MDMLFVGSAVVAMVGLGGSVIARRLFPQSRAVASPAFQVVELGGAAAGLVSMGTFVVQMVVGGAALAPPRTGPSAEERDRLVAELNTIGAECEAQKADVEGRRLRALFDIPSAKTAIAQYDGAIRTAENARVDADRRAARARDEAIDQATRVENEEIEAANEARQQYNPARVREAAIRAARDAYARRERSINLEGGTFEAQAAARRRAIADRDAAIEAAEQAFSRGKSDADETWAKATDAARKKSFLAQRAAAAQYDRQLDANETEYEDALARARRDRTTALRSDSASAVVEKQMDEERVRIDVACQTRKDVIFKKLRGEG